MKEMTVFKLEKNYLFWINLSAIAGLVILGAFFNLRLGYLKKSIFRNRQLLEQAFPGFSNENLAKFRQEVRNLKIQTLGLIEAFSPQGEWTKKDYDYSIYFVEDLNNTNKFLQEKAKSKQISYSDLGFKDKLPSEADALPMLNQLSGIKEIVNIGLDYNINFNSINPLGIEMPEKQKQIRLARTRMQLSGPKQGLMEFIIQLQE
ncbi:MAG: hypothetical protein HZA27_03910, partial [Candidatus Omnitrophica bacterium]|nr:hypothetical protein [Candidatus Omnitrophota bacterium]